MYVRRYQPYMDTILGTASEISPTNETLNDTFTVYSNVSCVEPDNYTTKTNSEFETTVNIDCKL